MTERSRSLFALAALFRGGLSARQALLFWHAELDGKPKQEATAIANRLQLGNSVQAALADSSYADLLGDAFVAHLSIGTDLASWIERQARDIEERHAAAGAARSAAAGAALSGRMVAGLPLLFVPLTPATGAPLTDPVGLAMLGIGIALALCGLRWIGRLLPRPPREDPTTELCLLLASLLQAGLSVTASLELAAARTTSAPLGRARRLAALGYAWPEALIEAGEGCAVIAGAIRRAQRFGLPLADGLEALAHARKAAQERAFDEKMRKAPVLMVVPLTCCILPAYGLLALGPFLRGMSVG